MVLSKSVNLHLQNVSQSICYLVILLLLMEITLFKKWSAEHTVMYTKYTIYCEGCWLFQKLCGSCSLWSVENSLEVWEAVQLAVVSAVSTHLGCLQMQNKV